MAKQIFSTPSGDNFFAGPSFSVSQKTWMVWPERTDNWRLGGKLIQEFFAKFINKLVNYHDVTVLVSKQQFQNARKKLNEKVRVIETSTNDCFIRDYGPYFLINPETNVVRGLKSSFNAWGGMQYGVYHPWDDDDMVPYKIFEIENIDYYEIPMVLDWGMILLDGRGVCFASEQGILSEIRNPNLTKEQAEYYLKEYLNVAKIIWLPYGLVNDQTKGRIDNVICLIDNHTILLSWTNIKTNDNYELLHETYEILKKCRDLENQLYQIIKIELPIVARRTAAEIENIDFSLSHNRVVIDQELVGSYTNVYITDKVALVPLFNCEITEDDAKRIYEKVFFDRKIIYIDVRELLLGKSGIHSIVCQQILKYDQH